MSRFIVATTSGATQGYDYDALGRITATTRPSPNHVDATTLDASALVGDVTDELTWRYSQLRDSSLCDGYQELLRWMGGTPMPRGPDRHGQGRQMAGRAVEGVEDPKVVALSLGALWSDLTTGRHGGGSSR